MKVWIYSETDGDAGDYHIKVFSCLENAEVYKLAKDSGYAMIREYEVDAVEMKKEPFRYDAVICDECGGEMIARTGTYGKFWGCKNYPECKGTRDSQGRSKKDRMKWREEQENKKVEDSVAGSEWNRNVQDGIRWKK